MKRVCVGIHVHAEPERLAATLAALRANTALPLDVLLLPDGPDAPTRDALARLAELSRLTSDEPLGVPACFNRLAANSEAEIIVLLESGALVGPGWLDLLLAALDADTSHGLAGPSTNRSWNEQGLFPREGGTLTEVNRTSQAASERFGAGTESAWRTLQPLYSLADFCYVVKREVVDAIGAADESYGQGPCWEMDYNIRAARAGWRGVWACAAYVWRAPFTARRQREEAVRFEASKRRYQDKFCALRLRGERQDYERHCRGDACERFAPTSLIQLTLPLPEPTPIAAAAPASPAVAVHSTGAVKPIDSPPLVTCIMPTRGRPDYVLQAVRYFLRQTYPARELLIIYEGPQDLPNDLPDDPRIRCVRMLPGASIGAKRNRACELAEGTIIAQWDDDDWYSPQRLAEQIAPLLAGQADITGLEAGIFFDLERWAFWRCTPELHRRLFVGDVHGGTLVFYRRVWERMARYPDRSLAEDAIFLRSATQKGARLHKVANRNIFVYLRHGSNAWSFATGHYLDSRAWLPVAEPPLPAEDRAFYGARSAAVRASAVATAAVATAAVEEPAKTAAMFPPAAQVAAEGTTVEPAASKREPALRPEPVSLPLVSCIMPTYNRRRYVAQAILYFLRQDYPSRELIILDDGDDRVADLAPSDDRIRYIALDRRMILGAKRNLACELARGQLVAHWDDDDWIAPRRLSYQCELLQSAAADLCGAARQLYFDPANDRAWLYEYPLAQRRWLAGNTLLYRKTFWERNRFAEIQVGEDTRFVWSPQARNTVLTPDSDFYVGLIHAANTSPKSLNGTFWRPRPVSEIHRLLGDDLAFYRGYPWQVRPPDISGALLNSAVMAR